jgi:signal transduction histidine kinase
MIVSAFHILRLAAAWFFTIFLVGAVFSSAAGVDPHPILLGLFAALMVVVLVTAFSHVRRVRLIVGKVYGAALSNRQRRQIEMPFEAGEAFDVMEAAVRELPGVEEVQSARDSLQLRAKLRRIEPYGASKRGGFARWFGIRNQILATVQPGDGIATLTLICEPEAGAWSDFYRVDDGTNLENAEAITRALTRRMAERRRGERAAATQTATEKELTVARLNLLHAQVEPHFLYNTLASAQHLTRTNPALADEMLGNLITYLRRSLPRTDDALSTLGDELERVRAYLDILRLRMGPRLSLQIDVPPSLHEVAFPTMMLQTLAENAIKHGLEPRTTGGTVWILASESAGKIAVTVADDGMGFGEQSAGTGIGLRNVRERLQLAYGDAARFDIVANFPSGVAATITVPMERPRG